MKIRTRMLGALLLITAGTASAGTGEVQSHRKISDTAGGFGGGLTDFAQFGTSVGTVGDVDGDGVDDLAVGARQDDDGGLQRGAVWILFMTDSATVKSHQKISATHGGFTGALNDFDLFGSSLAALGDLDNDGVSELAVGARLDDDGGNDRGAVWILFLNSNGTVKGHQKISDTVGGFTGGLDDVDSFGQSLAAIGDLDGDGVGDLAVGTFLDDDGGGALSNRGAVWVLFMNGDGTVKGHQKISDTQGGFGGTLVDGDLFGTSVASVGDIDGDLVPDLAVGAYLDDDGGFNRGAVWVLFMNPNGTVKAHQKISDTAGGFAGTLDDEDVFGTSVGSLGDLDGDGVGDIVVGAMQDDDGGVPPLANRGAVWVLFIDGDGTVKSHQKISDTAGGFGGTLDDNDNFGVWAAGIGDRNGDGISELAVGAYHDDDGGLDRGSVWILFFQTTPTAVASTSPARIELFQNYPNPFNPSTRIDFTLDHTAPVRLSIYDAAGRHVVTLLDGNRKPGDYSVEWNGRDRHGKTLATGVYFYRLDSGELSITRKAVLLK